MTESEPSAEVLRIAEALAWRFCGCAIEHKARHEPDCGAVVEITEALAPLAARAEKAEAESAELRADLDRYRMSPTADGGFRFQWRDRAIAAEQERDEWAERFRAASNMLSSMADERDSLKAALEGIRADGHEKCENQRGDYVCVEPCACCVAERVLGPLPSANPEPPAE